LEVAVFNGRLAVVKEGRARKFLNDVEQVTFSGNYAVMRQQQVLFITGRCVFKLSQEGLELVEIAPGIDIEKDILDQMEFKPVIKEAPKLMDACIFLPEPMGSPIVSAESVEVEDMLSAMV
jgi:propionate CoA-transferase